MDFVKSKPKKKSTKRSFLPALIFKWVVVFVVLVGFTVYYFLTSPLKGRTTVALVGSSITLVSVESETKTATVIAIPDEAYFKSTYGKGFVLSSSLLKLDQISKKRGKLLTSTLREFLGVPVDSWLYVGVSNPTSKEDFFDLLERELSLDFIRKNLTSFYTHRFLFQLKNIRADKVNFVNLNENNIFHKEILADGSEILSADSISIDTYLKELFYERDILREANTISILNGGVISGLAGTASRIITNSGGHVIMIGENPTKTDRCIIQTGKNNKNSYTVKRYAKIFNCIITVKEELNDNRFDITLTVGLDYKDELFGKL